jgi:hypothetical protein
MTTVVRFTQEALVCEPIVTTAYVCDLPGDQSGEYVPLAEYEAIEELFRHSAQQYTQADDERGKLEALIARVNEIAPDLFNIFDGNAHWKSTELEQLLADCRGAVEE